VLGDCLYIVIESQNFLRCADKSDWTVAS